MCCMWSTSNPPDSIEDTAPIRDLEAAFDIDIVEQDAIDLYDMNLDEAVRRILELKSRQTAPAVLCADVGVSGEG